MMGKHGKQEIYTPPPNDLPTLSAYAQRLQQERNERANVFPPQLALSFGEPHFRTPEHIRHAATEAIQLETIGYGPAAGWLWLRELVAEKIKRVNGYEITPENSAITIGGTGALQSAFTAILREGDEVLLPDPGWPPYRTQIMCCGARPVPYTLHPQHGWQPDIAQLSTLVSPRTRMLLINSPANPTGAVFSHQCMADLLTFARRHDLYLLTDECYDEIVFDGEHISPATLLSADEFEASNVVCVYSFSKTYAMTGWRIGYVIANKDLITTISNVLAASYTNISTIVQRAAAAALTGPRSSTDEMIDTYRTHRDLALRIVRHFGYNTHTPGGTFYLLLDISSSAYTHCRDFCRDLVRERNIIVAPGTTFGNCATHYVRISLAAPTADVTRGITEICTFIDQHR